MTAAPERLGTQGEAAGGTALLHDSALSRPAEDRLGRAPFAEQLARTILSMNAGQGFVFSINGPWGSGKTTLINFVVSFLHEMDPGSRNLVVVRFNPWWFSGQEQLIRQFFRQLASSLRSPDRPAQLRNIAQKLETLGRLLEPVSVLARFGIAPGVGGVLGGAKGVLGQVSARLRKHADEANDVHALRESIDKILREQNARILVVMDDIDRLTADEIRQVFQLVKAVADFPNTIYLLAFDPKIVSRALDTVLSEDGAAFLEKIVQAPFDLPLMDRSGLRDILFQELNSVVAPTPDELWDQQTWENIFWDGLDPLLRSVRDAKRFVNAVGPAYAAVVGEVHGVDFLGIQALRVFVPGVYAFVRANADLLTGGDDSWLPGGVVRGTESKAVFDGVLTAVPEAQRGAANALLTRLFPRWAAAFGGGTHGSDWLGKWRKQRRVCSPEVFELYFRLSLLPGEISHAQMLAILGRAGDTDALAADLRRLASEQGRNGKSQARQVLDRLQDFTERDIGLEVVEPVLSVLFTVGDELIASDREGPFEYGPRMLMLRILYQLLRRLPSQDARFDVLRRTMSTGPAVSIISHEVAVLGQEHGIGSSSEVLTPEEQRTVSLDQLKELEQIALDRIRSLEAAGSLGKTPGLLSVLFDAASWGAEEEAKQWATAMVADDAGLADFLVGCASVGYSSSSGDRTSKAHWSISATAVQGFTGQQLQDLLPRCQQILQENPDWLDAQRRHGVQVLVDQLTKPQDDFFAWVAST